MYPEYRYIKTNYPSHVYDDGELPEYFLKFGGKIECIDTRFSEVLVLEEGLVDEVISLLQGNMEMERFVWE